MSSSESRRLKGVVTYRLHENDLLELQEEAAALGLSVAGLVREMSMDKSVRRHFAEKWASQGPLPALTRSA